METITITLDGREVSGYSGMTILELACESGINIPTLCYDPYLNPNGACRICLVENESTGALLASCVTPIARGMVINTSSPKVLERRTVIVKLMLASHPDSCLVCDKGNRCQLRQIASDLGIGLVDYQRIPQPGAIEEVNPFIERDLSKCILCAKCIRADHELVVEGAIDYLSRGFITKPATLNDMPLEKSECTFCGTCVALCPTGALMEKERAGRGTTATTIDTVCPYCGCGCSLSLEIRGNHIVRARPGKESVVNHGALCVRGSYGYDFVHSSERLTSPLRRVNGDFEKISWEQALNLVAAELGRIKETYGPSSLSVFGSTKCTNEENYLLQRFARGVLGTNNIDNGSRLYSAASQVGLDRNFSSLPTMNTINDLERSAVILVIGTNPEFSAPVVSYAIKRAIKYKGAKLILVDPQPTKLASFTRLWLKPKIGTDVALINGLARVIITEGLLDKEAITRNMNNFDAFSQALEKYSPEYVEKITGVSSEEISHAARLFAEAKQASIVYGNGITQHVNGTDGVVALANLAMLTGGGIYALQRDSNALGACDMGALPDFLPGHRGVDNSQAGKKFEDRWGVSLPADAGLTAMEMIEHIKEGKLKTMYIVGENPALSFPKPSLIKAALASLDFLVVQDIFLTETAKLANVVLPAASFAEKEGTLTNFEGRVQRLCKAIEPLGESLPDWQIILRLASSMGHPMPYSSLQQVTDEISDMVPLYQGRHVDTVKPSSSSSGFALVKYNPTKKTRANGYLFTLLAGTILYQFGSGSRSSRSKRLNQFCPQSFVEIGEADAKRIGLKHSDKVKVISPVGEVTTTVKVSPTLPQGMLFMPIAFPESPVGELFDVTLDPQARSPALKACKVRLEKVDANG
jgi:formate dehydrogenase alpha subunit